MLISPSCQNSPDRTPAAVEPSASTSSGRIGTVLNATSPEAQLLAQLSVPTRPCVDVLQAISDIRSAAVVAEASPTVLTSLADHPQAVRAFTASGRWLMLWGLTPAGLPEFNRLVGVEHILRPFTVEAVRLPKHPDPLLSGANPYDFLMLSGTGMLGIPLHAGDVWSYVLDGDDIAPFSRLPPASYWCPGQVTEAGSDRFPPNLVNGLDYSWQLGFTIPIEKPAYLDWTFTFPRRETVTALTLIPDFLYKRITRIRISFPGSSTAPIICPVEPNALLVRQVFPVPAVSCLGLRLEILDMFDPAGGVTGIRKVAITVQRPDEVRSKVQQLLSIGVLNKYPMGAGGIVINQMRVAGSQQHDNRVKQLAIMAVLMRNLRTPLVAGPAHPPGGPSVISDAHAVQVEDFMKSADIDDTDAIRRAIDFAIKRQIPHVRFGPGTFYYNAFLEVQGAKDLLLEGTLGADGRPATTLVFLVPSRFNTPFASNLVSGVSTRNFRFVFSSYR